MAALHSWEDQCGIEPRRERLDGRHGVVCCAALAAATVPSSDMATMHPVPSLVAHCHATHWRHWRSSRGIMVTVSMVIATASAATQLLVGSTRAATTTWASG